MATTTTTTWQQQHKLPNQIQTKEQIKRFVNATNRTFQHNTVHTAHAENNSTTDEVLDTFKQKLAALSKRVKRYKDSNKDNENKIFHEHTGKCYTVMCLGHEAGYWGCILGIKCLGHEADCSSASRAKFKNIYIYIYTHIVCDKN
jgi:hypothetical protein